MASGMRMGRLQWLKIGHQVAYVRQVGEANASNEHPPKQEDMSSES